MTPHTMHTVCTVRRAHLNSSPGFYSRGSLFFWSPCAKGLLFGRGFIRVSTVVLESWLNSAWPFKPCLLSRPRAEHCQHGWLLQLVWTCTGKRGHPVLELCTSSGDLIQGEPVMQFLLLLTFAGVTLVLMFEATLACSFQLPFEQQTSALRPKAIHCSSHNLLFLTRPSVWPAAAV